MMAIADKNVGSLQGNNFAEAIIGKTYATTNSVGLTAFEMLGIRTLSKR
jgi:hypothetical protein